MKKKNTFTKFEGYELKETKNIKGGVRAAPNNPGGSGGSSWIDWGDVDIRNPLGQVSIIQNGKLSSSFFG